MAFTKIYSEGNSIVISEIGVVDESTILIQYFSYEINTHLVQIVDNSKKNKVYSFVPSDILDKYEEVIGDEIAIALYLSKLNKTGDVPFFMSASLGLVTGMEPFTKFGRNPVINTTTDPEDIWEEGGLYTGFPDVAGELEILSANDNDTDGGSGARIVTVSNLLDIDGNRMDDVDILLNGQTPVSLGPEEYFRASRAFVITAGASNGCEGKITVRHKNTPANIFVTIEPQLNQSQVFAYTVPKGYTLIIPYFNINISRLNGAAVSGNIHVKTKDIASNIFLTVRNADITNSASYEFKGQSYFVVPELIDVKATTFSVSANGTSANGEANGFLRKN